jgi:hypothetical protein
MVSDRKDEFGHELTVVTWHNPVPSDTKGPVASR